MLRIDISCVRRCGFVGNSGGNEEETWIIGYIGSEGFEIALSAALISTIPFELGLLLRGLKLWCGIMLECISIADILDSGVPTRTVVAKQILFREDLGVALSDARHLSVHHRKG